MPAWIRKQEISIPLLSFAIVIGLWIWIPGYLSNSIQELPERGAFGDTYGTVNALFTGLALVALITVIILQIKGLGLQTKELGLQTKELSLQKEEMQLAKKELELTREEIKKQGETFELQRFESTFFQLLRALMTSISELAIYSSGPIERGDRAVQGLKGKFSEDLKNRLQGHDMTNLRTVEEQTGQAFLSIRELQHCLNMVVTILGFIDTSDIEKKPQYYSFVRNQLSEDFLFLLAYHLIDIKSHSSETISLCQRSQVFQGRFYGFRMIDESHGDIIGI